MLRMVRRLLRILSLQYHCRQDPERLFGKLFDVGRHLSKLGFLAVGRHSGGKNLKTFFYLQLPSN
jgi:hypothetical protein